jgi:hypothetical protein
MEPDPVIIAPGQVGKFHQGVVVNTKVVLAAEADLRPAVLGFNSIALDYGHVGHTRLRPEVTGPLDDDITLDIGHPYEAPAVVILVLGEGEERQKSQDRNQQDCLFHLRSPYTLDYCNPCANLFCLKNREKRPLIVLN